MPIISFMQIGPHVFDCKKSRSPRRKNNARGKVRRLPA
jgi:hypothetical protein